MIYLWIDEAAEITPAQLEKLKDLRQPNPSAGKSVYGKSPAQIALPEIRALKRLAVELGQTLTLTLPKPSINGIFKIYPATPEGRIVVNYGKRKWRLPKGEGCTMRVKKFLFWTYWSKR